MAAVLGLKGRELIVDSFAGGGGASTGIEMALGRSPDIAINHSSEALAMHALNHPKTRHYCENIWKVDPLDATGGRHVRLAWFSPDCRHFSPARGGKPVNRKIRGLAWTVYHWAKAVRPDVFVTENIVAFRDWGPLLADDRPCPIRKGMTYRRWWRQLENLGYTLDARELSARDFGTPTTRKRLFIVGRCDGEPVRWPEPTHGPGLLPYRTAAECIDWSIPCPSIFDPERKLKEATMRRVARGIVRYVLQDRNPYVLEIGGQTVAPFIGPLTHQGDRRLHPANEPFPTVTAAHRGEHALIVAFLAKHYGGHETPGSSLRAPMDTITSRDHNALVQALLLKHSGEPLDPRVAALGEMIRAKGDFGTVRIRGQLYRIVDIGMRGLEAIELYRAQGFPRGIKLLGTKTSQIQLCGNAVCPPVAEAIIRANFLPTAQAMAA